VLKYEVPLIKHALRQLDCQTQVTVIVANKKQGIRFFPGRASP
jgi:O-glycosyl hydrolase